MVTSYLEQFMLVWIKQLKTQEVLLWSVASNYIAEFELALLTR